jgi:hypothetical protein
MSLTIFSLFCSDQEKEGGWRGGGVVNYRNMQTYIYVVTLRLLPCKQFRLILHSQNSIDARVIFFLIFC